MAFAATLTAYALVALFSVALAEHEVSEPLPQPAQNNASSRWQCFETAALVSNKNQTETGNVLRRRPSQNIAIAISKHCHHHVPVRGPAGTIHLKLFETFLAMF